MTTTPMASDAEIMWWHKNLHFEESLTGAKADSLRRILARLAASESRCAEVEKENATMKPIITNALCIIQYNKAAMDSQLLKHLAEPIIIHLKDGEVLSDDMVARIRGAISE